MYILISSMILIILSGFFSLAEASLVAANHIKLKTTMKLDKKIQYIIDNKKDYLGSIIVANTIVNISGSMIVGTLIAIAFPVDSGSFIYSLNLSIKEHILPINISTGMASIGINVIVTYCILVFAEMIPKFWASTHPEKVLSYIKFPLFFLKFLMIPFLLITKGIFGRFIKESAIETISKEEVNASISVGINEGIFADKAANLLKNTVELTEHCVCDWVFDDFEIETIDENTHINSAIDILAKTHHRRLLTRDSNSDISGVVLTEDIYRSYVNKCDLMISDLKHKILKINKSSKMIDVIEKLNLAEDHLVVIVDDNEDICGVISTDDILLKLVS